MKATTTRLLAHSKEFFISGESELEQKNAMAYMQAVLKFHDAVEFCLRAIIEEHTLNHDRNALLKNLIKIIDTDLAPKKLPLASQMDFLNTTRGKIKHHASIPSFEDVQRCHLNTEEFLRKVVEDYFGRSFLSISRVLLVEDPTVRQYLGDAEKEAEKGEYLEALILIKKAFYVAQPAETIFVSRDGSFNANYISRLFRDMPEIKEQIKTMVDKIVEKFNELESKVALLMMGIDVLKLQRFEEITPQFSPSFFFFRGSKYPLYISWNDNIIPTGELVKEASNYVIDMTLLWQNKGIVGHRTDTHFNRRRLQREVREEVWSIESE